MEKIRKTLLYAALSCIILGIITLGIPIFAIIELSLGGYILYIRSQEDLKIQSQKKTLTILAITTLIFNQIASVFLFIAIDYIDELKRGHQSTAPPNNNLRNITSSQFQQNIPQKEIKEKPYVDPEVKKIDILLKLGVAMVAISGLLFATTSWELITDPIKVIALIIMGILFLGLSELSDRKLHIESTTFTYWLLSVFFFVFAIVSIGTLGIFGNWLTYEGAGKNLMYAITYGTISGLSYLTYKKKSIDIFMHITYTGILVTLYNLLRLCTLSRMYTVSIITTIILIINITQKENKTSLQSFSKVISYIAAWAPIIITKESFIANLLACTLNIININYLARENAHSNEGLTITSSIFSYVLLTKLLTFLDLNIYNAPIAILIYTIFSLILNYIRINNSQSYKICNQVLYYIFSIFYFLVATIESEKTALISSTIILTTNLINFYFDKENQTNSYIQPLVILIFVSSLCGFINSQDIILNGVSVIAILVIIYTVIYHFTKEPNRKKLYYWCSVLTLIGTIYNSCENIEKVSALIATAGFIYHYIIEKENNRRTAMYVALLLSIYLTVVQIELFALPIVYNALIVLWLYVIIKFFLKETKTIESITSIAITIPAYTITANISIPSEYQAILETSLSLYVLYLIVKLFIKEQKTKSFVSIAGLTILLLNIIQPSMVIGLYVGVIGIIVTMIGFYNKEYKEFFITGISITVINILYQLQDLWAKIPFWLYLLATGLGLIGFVTYKEIKKSEQQNKKTMEKQNVHSTQETQHSNELPIVSNCSNNEGTITKETTKIENELKYENIVQEQQKAETTQTEEEI